MYSKYYSISAMLNELCIPDSDTIVNKLQQSHGESLI